MVYENKNIYWRSPPWLGWSLWNICLQNDHGYVSLVVSSCRSFANSSLITRIAIILTLLEQELLTLPEHLSVPPIFIGVRNTRSLVLCVYLVDLCLSLWPFSFVNIIFHFLTRFMASDYPFGILRFSKLCHKCQGVCLEGKSLDLHLNG